MTQRITNADINAVLGRYVRACQRLEMVPPEGFRLRRSSTSYELYSVVGTNAAPGTHMGWLGSTKREAYNTLMTMALTLEAYLHHTNQL